MDLLFICSNARGDSLVSNVVLCKEARKTGVDAGVLFSGEALATLADSAFLWPRGLMGQDLRLKMADNGKEIGLPLTFGGMGQGRQIDLGQIVTQAKEDGIPMYACPLWSRLLGISGKMPEGILEIDMPGVIAMMKEAKAVIGAV